MALATGATAVVPALQAVPQPYHQISFQRDGLEIARYHFGPELRRPFVFPVIGPAGRVLTRMGHPHDPESHGHHNSVWISHQSVEGVNFWEDRPGPARIAHRRIERLTDGAEEAAVLCQNEWLGTNGAPILLERRRIAVRAMPNREWLLLLDVELRAVAGEVELGATPFGILGVRVAKTLGVKDGGGTIRNSEGGVNEAGVFRRPAKWVDYTGPVAPGIVEGLTLLDHPENPNHPTPFHVRDDGWMGPCLTLRGPLVVREEPPLRLRYGLYVHSGMPAPSRLEEVWRWFADLPRDAEPSVRRGSQ
ncbi:MAG: PmoA family protein [Kiritimatiellae bacterium]|nr:PmoA family protein [Kiritimatiellia bacterium]